jgi:TPR repeat protein
MIRSYCSGNVEQGILILQLASCRSFSRASYALGLMLRDYRRDDSKKYLMLAAKQGYLPAEQEILTGEQMRDKHGELDADELEGI